MQHLLSIFGDAVEIKMQEGARKLPFIALSEDSKDSLAKFEQKLILKAYSPIR